MMPPRGLATESVAEITEYLKGHPLFAGIELEFVNSFSARHSHVLKFRDKSGRLPCTLIVKHVAGRTRDKGKQALVQEVNALNYLGEAAGPELQGTFPVPLLFASDATFLAYQELPGLAFSSLVRRHANRITGSFCGGRVCRIAESIGSWLRHLHRVTKQPSRPHDSEAYLANLLPRLDKCKQVLRDPALAGAIFERASRRSRELNGEFLTFAASHGDLLPQNILVSGDRIAVIDFENFRVSGPVGEDLGSFTAYLSLLAGSPLYDRALLGRMMGAFLTAYGPVKPALLELFLLKWAITIISDSRPAKNLARRLIRANLEQQLALLSATCNDGSYGA